jgi:D-tyrosyl-tRNA(Tyr) deacylase
MRAVVQRVSRAKVEIDGAVSGEIGKGILLLLGIHQSDSEKELEWMVNKISKLRIFEDEEGKMNHSLLDVGGDILVVSQFTLYGDVRKGTRPSFIEAGKPDMAEPLYERSLELFEEKGIHTQSGEFGAMMDVSLTNDGPVTIILDK